MSDARRAKLGATLLGAALLTASLSAADTFGLGDGHSGALLVLDAGTVVNAYVSLTADAGSGTLNLPVSSTAPFQPRDLVLVYQAQDVLAVDAGDQTPLNIASSGAGAWQLARIAGADGGMLVLQAPLETGFRGGLSEVVRVPEFTQVTIGNSAGLVAQPWNGLTGGVVAFLAQGIVFNGGSIQASAAGFRGGAAINKPSCSGHVALAGEGVAAGLYGTSPTSRGNFANAGGGGQACNAGGGGGGSGGVGGQGGYTRF